MKKFKGKNNFVKNNKYQQISLKSTLTVNIFFLPADLTVDGNVHKVGWQEMKHS